MSNSGNWLSNLVDALFGPASDLHDPLLRDHYDVEHGVEMERMAADPAYEKAYYTDLYNDAFRYKHGEQADYLRVEGTHPLNPEDFYFQMISASGTPNTEYADLNGWWMLSDHRIAQIIAVTCIEAQDDEEFHRWQPVLVRQSVLGTLVAYTDEQVGKCVDYVVEKCKEYELAVNAPEEQAADPPVAEETAVENTSDVANQEPVNEIAVEIPLHNGHANGGVAHLESKKDN